MPLTYFDNYTPNALFPYIDPEDSQVMHHAFVPAGAGVTYTLVKGTVVAQVTATKLYAAYNNALATGVEVARGVLMYTITIDENGWITISSDHTMIEKTAPIYTKGAFLSTDLTGMDAAGLADLQGWIVTGDLTTGVIRF